MKTTFNTIKYFCIFPLMFGLGNADAQILKGLGDKVKKSAERTIERRAERETSQKTDDVLDAVTGKKKNKKNNSSEKSSENSSGNENRGNSKTKNNTTVNRNSDFEPGNKTLFIEDFSQDNLNDLPAKWNTTASAKVTTLSGSSTRWMEFSSPGVFLWDNVKTLPENFTLEFDLFVPNNFSYYDAPLWFVIADTKNRRELMIWEKFKEKRGKDKRNGVLLMLHPQEEGAQKKGYSEYEIWENSEKIASNRLKSINVFNVNNNQIKVQIWKQKQRLRVYLDGEKIWDLPQAFENGQTLNSILFSRYEAKEGHYFYISNLRLASSEEDLRSKILKEGRFSTNAILFATNSSSIKPESNDIISQIAEVLKQESSLKLKIIGHTDSDGKKDANLTLSKQRAESVKTELVKKYGISATRLETDGKGDTEPVSDNSTANGKSQNRRVEFVKMN